jgi:hypothetical protein
MKWLRVIQQQCCLQASPCSQQTQPATAVAAAAADSLEDVLISAVM